MLITILLYIVLTILVVTTVLVVVCTITFQWSQGAAKKIEGISVETNTVRGSSSSHAPAPGWHTTGGRAGFRRLLTSHQSFRRCSFSGLPASSATRRARSRTVSLAAVFPIRLPTGSPPGHRLRPSSGQVHPPARESLTQAQARQAWASEVDLWDPRGYCPVPEIPDSTMVDTHLNNVCLPRRVDKAQRVHLQPKRINETVLSPPYKNWA